MGDDTRASGRNFKIRYYQRIKIYSMDIKVGKKFMISGMTIEIISDDGDKWETRNVTTREAVLFDKLVLLKAIKLGKAEEIED